MVVLKKRWWSPLEGQRGAGHGWARSQWPVPCKVHPLIPNVMLHLRLSQQCTPILPSHVLLSQFAFPWDC